MQIAGIIAEYNPFHNGHAWQLAEARRRGASAVIVAMSSGAVQRGSLPLLPESVRVRAALAAGADAVIELPAACACSGAEAFAAAGVALLAAAGCDTLVCGVEDATAQTAFAAARILLSESYRTALKAALAGGARNFAAAREAAFAAALGETEEFGARAAEKDAASRGTQTNGILPAEKPDAAALCRTLTGPNNTLAVEYAKAILQQNTGMALCVLPRVGVGHHDTESAAAGGTAYAAASRLRQCWRAEGVPTVKPYVPEAAFALYEQAVREGWDIDPHAADLAVLSRLRAVIGTQHGAPAFAEIRGTSEGLDHALENAVKTATDIDALCDALTTVRYPRARMRRLVLDAALGIPAGMPVRPPYVHILGARREMLPLVSRGALPASVSLARLAEAGPECAAFAAVQARAADLAALCRRTPEPMGQAFSTPCVLL